MRKTLHYCLASHDEVMFRSTEDLNWAFNCLAIAANETESRILGESFMSDHMHTGIQTDSLSEFSHKYRYPYTRFFNNKYHRSGRLGERNAFHLEMIGLKHISAGMSYIFRQGLHHGLTTTPFGYEHTSINKIFAKELGKIETQENLPRSSMWKFLPDHATVPDGWRMSPSGLLFREDVVDTKYVEELFITPKSFQYYMSRPTDEKWKAEQLEESEKCKPIDVGMIEKGVVSDVELLKRNEFGRPDLSRMTDLELCSLIDKQILPRMNVQTVYDLSISQRRSVGNSLWTKYGKARNSSGKFVTAQQLKRCLIIP